MKYIKKSLKLICIKVLLKKKKKLSMKEITKSLISYSFRVYSSSNKASRKNINQWKLNRRIDTNNNLNKVILVKIAAFPVGVVTAPGCVVVVIPGCVTVDNDCSNGLRSPTWVENWALN